MAGITDYTVILVEPKHPGNVGAVARAMSNFGFSRLVIVSDTDFSAVPEARQRAKHGLTVLENAVYAESLASGIGSGDYTRVIGTSGKTAFSEGDSIRVPVMLPDILDYLDTSDRVALAFGREDHGLLDSELALCSMLVTIPTAEENPILNLSHAVAVVLYHIYVSEGAGRTRFTELSEPAGTEEMMHLEKAFYDLMEAADYREFKKDITLSAFSRVVGRAGLTRWEFYRIIGVLTRARKMIRGELGHRRFTREDSTREDAPPQEDGGAGE